MQSAYLRKSMILRRNTLISSSPTSGGFAYSVSFHGLIYGKKKPSILYFYISDWTVIIGFVCLSCFFSLVKKSDGAGLFYTSVKEEKNLNLLYKYIVHKLYDFQFTTPALVVEKDAVFM